MKLANNSKSMGNGYGISPYTVLIIMMVSLLLHFQTYRRIVKLPISVPSFIYTSIEMPHTQRNAEKQTKENEIRIH